MPKAKLKIIQIMSEPEGGYGRGRFDPVKIVGLGNDGKLYWYNGSTWSEYKV